MKIFGIKKMAFGKMIVMASAQDAKELEYTAAIWEFENSWGEDDGYIYARPKFVDIEGDFAYAVYWNKNCRPVDKGSAKRTYECERTNNNATGRVLPNADFKKYKKKMRYKIPHSFH